MENLSALPAAVCFGLAAGMLALFLMRTLAMVETGAKMSDDARRSFPTVIRLLLPLLPLFRRPAAAAACAALRAAVEPRLWMAGFGEVLGAADFVALKFAAAAAGLGCFAAGIAAGQPLAGGLMAVLIALYPTVWLNTRIARRHNEILKALPNVLDLLTLSVEAGKDFMTSLRDVLQRRRIDALGEELLRTFQEIQLGRTRTEALRDLSRRVRQPDLTAVVNAIIQAEELGVSIGQLLRIQGDMLRGKRFTLAEKRANETPVKIIFPIVLFIFPAVMLILIVPIGLKIVEVLR